MYNRFLIRFVSLRVEGLKVRYSFDAYLTALYKVGAERVGLESERTHLTFRNGSNAHIR